MRLLVNLFISLLLIGIGVFHLNGAPKEPAESQPSRRFLGFAALGLGGICLALSVID